ncbi:TD and POZ domain-containing protein 1 [Trichonephila clavipes]|nr:TD and POZ domain-containing protein 1 [Trichonephila clavipes]
MDCKGICKDGLTFTWSIENFSCCGQKNGKCIKSLKFDKKIGILQWYLLLYPRGFNDNCKDFISFYLFSHSNIVCNIDFELSFIAVDGSVLVSKRLHVNDFKPGKTSGCDEFVRREEVLNIRRKDYLPGDVLTARCRIRDLDENNARDGHWFIRTQIEVQRRSFLWNIENFSSFQESICEILPDTTLKFFPSLGKNCKTFIHLEACAHSVNFYGDIIFRIHLVDSSGDCTECLKEKFMLTESINTAFFTLTFSKEELMKNENLYLQNDILQLYCECDFNNYSRMNQVTEKVCWGCPLILGENMTKKGLESKKMTLDSTRTLKENLESSYKENLFCDMKLKTKTGSFPAHKFILSARSLVFRNMFTIDMKEKSSGCVDIDDLDDDTVQRMLLYIYTATMPDLQWNSACNLYAAADKYEILSLKSECSSFLKDNLSPDNALDLLILSDMHQDEDLKSSTEKFILNHRDIFQTNEWKLIMKTNSQLAADLMYQTLED